MATFLRVQVASPERRWTADSLAWGEPLPLAGRPRPIRAWTRRAGGAEPKEHPAHGLRPAVHGGPRHWGTAAELDALLLCGVWFFFVDQPSPTKRKVPSGAVSSQKSGPAAKVLGKFLFSGGGGFIHDANSKFIRFNLRFRRKGGGEVRAPGALRRVSHQPCRHRRNVGEPSVVAAREGWRRS